MQKTITGYQFFEKELATGARSELVSTKALPKKKGDVTIYWQNYEQAALDKPTFWYMRGDKSMVAAMGEPSKFTVTFPGKSKEEPEEPGEGGIKLPPEGGIKLPIKGE